MATHEIDGKGIPNVDSLTTFSKGKVAPSGQPDGEGGQRRGAPQRRQPRQPEASGSQDISDLASAVFGLEQVQRTHPDKFARVLSEVAAALERDSAGANEAHARLLRELAHSFREGARTRTLPSLLVAGPLSASHPGTPHPHVQSYAAQQAVAGGDAVRDASLDLAQVIRGAMRTAGI